MGVCVICTFSMAALSLIAMKFPVVPVSAFARMALGVCADVRGVKDVEVTCLCLGSKFDSLTKLATPPSLTPTPQHFFPPN